VHKNMLQWMEGPGAGSIQTGSSMLDQIITVLLSTSMFVALLLGFILDNTIPGQILHKILRGGQRFNHLNGGKILGRHPDKSLPPCYSQSPLKLYLEISISSNSRNLLQFLVLLLYTAKEKEENMIENHTHFPMV
jgi:hypothetical protein